MVTGASGMIPRTMAPGVSSSSFMDVHSARERTRIPAREGCGERFRELRTPPRRTQRTSRRLIRWASDSWAGRPEEGSAQAWMTAHANHEDRLVRWVDFRYGPSPEVSSGHESTKFRLVFGRLRPKFRESRVRAACGRIPQIDDLRRSRISRAPIRGRVDVANHQEPV
jgi:hypothetical protein